MNENVYTVKQVNSYIKHLFQGDYVLNKISVRGEVSNCKYHTSGHIYFSLKDESGTIACVMFAGKRGGLSFRMEEGQQVVVTGEISVYERDGRYQVYASLIEEAGKGRLYQEFLRLKEMLEEMGYFSPIYKKELPVYANKIGIVTAKTGAAIQDMIQISKRRNPYVQLILYPAKVQGEGAKESIVEGIRALDAYGVDIIIVGRGGGSMEDLWAFNEEVVAEAIFHCETPVISAVGHETDTTIADFVADMRAPTPSAAAELAVWDYRQIAQSLVESNLQLQRQMKTKLEWYRLRLKEKAGTLRYLHPRHSFLQKQQRLVDLEEKWKKKMEEKLLNRKHRFSLLMEGLKRVSPLEKLSGGYAFIQGRETDRVKSVQEVRVGDELLVHLLDGTILSRIEEVREEHV